MKRYFNIVRQFIKETDKYLFFICILTSAFGLLMVLSATKYNLAEGKIFSRDFLIMGLAILVGVIVCLVISGLDYQIFTKLWLIIGAICVVMMLGLFVFGTGPAARPDARTWYRFGPISFQPSELVKIGFTITFSVHLEKLKDNLNSPKSIIQLAAHAMIPVALVALTGDMGSSLVFIIMTVVMLFVAGVHWGYFVGGIALVAAVSPLAWIYGLKQLQKDRFLALLYPERYPDIIYQQKYGMNAIGSGGFTGQGLFKGSYTQSGVVPESQNDMIFSVIGEELGFIGCVVALLLLALICIRIISIGKSTREQSTNLICSGIAAMIASQALVNIGMCLMLLPVVGITLPFFSAGGSSNLCVYIGIGLVLSIYRHNLEHDAVSIKVYDSLK